MNMHREKGGGEGNQFHIQYAAVWKAIMALYLLMGRSVSVAMFTYSNPVQPFLSHMHTFTKTGSGKTFTITGGVEKYADRGIIPRTLSYLFQQYLRVRQFIHLKTLATLPLPPPPLFLSFVSYLPSLPSLLSLSLSLTLPLLPSPPLSLSFFSLSLSLSLFSHQGLFTLPMCPTWRYTMKVSMICSILNMKQLLLRICREYSHNNEQLQ